MVETVRFKKEHLAKLEEHCFRMCGSISAEITDAQLEKLEQRGHSYSVVDGDLVLACAGVTEVWPGRAEAWALLDKNLKENFIKVHNQVKRFLENVDIDRVEALVDAEFKEGLRWVKALGFIIEAPRMKKFGKLGEDMVLLSRVRG